MRISDWSSDVCSSDLHDRARYHAEGHRGDGRVRAAKSRDREDHRKIERVGDARAQPRVQHHAGDRREADPDDGPAIDVDRSAQGRHDVTSASIGYAQTEPIAGDRKSTRLNSSL